MFVWLNHALVVRICIICFASGYASHLVSHDSKCTFHMREGAWYENSEAPSDWSEAIIIPLYIKITNPSFPVHSITLNSINFQPIKKQTACATLALNLRYNKVGRFTTFQILKNAWRSLHLTHAIQNLFNTFLSKATIQRRRSKQLENVVEFGAKAED